MCVCACVLGQRCAGHLLQEHKDKLEKKQPRPAVGRSKKGVEATNEPLSMSLSTVLNEQPGNQSETTGETQRVEPANFHIALSELRIYFDKKGVFFDEFTG